MKRAFSLLRVLFLFLSFNLTHFVHAEVDMTQSLQEFEGFYDKLLPAQEKSEEAFVWFSQIPHFLFNAVMHFYPGEDVGAQVDAILHQLPDRMPISFWLHGQKEVAVLLEERGFQSLMTCPLMVWPVQPLMIGNAEIKPAQIGIFMGILSSVYQFDEAVKNGLSTLIQNKGAENYLLYCNGEPLATGTLIPHEKAGGIFNIAVLPNHQKKAMRKS